MASTATGSGWKDGYATCTRASSGCTAPISEDLTACGEVGTLYYFHKLLDCDVGIIEHHDDTVYSLTHVMGRDIGSHTYGDTYGTVDKKVRES